MSHCRLSWGREQQFSYNAAFTTSSSLRPPNKNAVFLPNSIFSSMLPQIAAVFPIMPFCQTSLACELNRDIGKIEWFPVAHNLRLHRRDIWDVTKRNPDSAIYLFERNNSGARSVFHDWEQERGDGFSVFALCLSDPSVFELCLMKPSVFYYLIVGQFRWQAGGAPIWSHCC